MRTKALYLDAAVTLCVRLLSKCWLVKLVRRATSERAGITVFCISLVPKPDIGRRSLFV